MIGAIIGDIVGSAYEFHNIKTKAFPLFSAKSRFTDDTVMTCAVAETLMQYIDEKERHKKKALQNWPYFAPEDTEPLSEMAKKVFHEMGRPYPRCGFGGRFWKWMYSDTWVPYGSCGNGSAMRISAVGDIADSVETAKILSYSLTCITHDHPEGLKGAEAAAVAKVLLKEGKTLNQVEAYINDHYYNLDKTVSELRNETNGHGAELCQVSMPQAFTCLFEGDSFEDVIRNCISIGGDSDTIAAIAGGIAEAVYPVPEWMAEEAKRRLSYHLLDIVNRWEKFCE